MGVVIFDIDHFKNVNDTRGHDTGDQVLQQFAQRIQANLRKNDIFGRWGGEEFVLIAPSINEENLYKLAEKLRVKVAERPFIPDAPLKLTMSAGIALLEKEESFLSAFKRADVSLYEAKAEGRNRVVVAKPSS